MKPILPSQPPPGGRRLRLAPIKRTLRLWKFATDIQLRFVMRAPMKESGAGGAMDVDVEKGNVERDLRLGSWIKDEMVALGPAFMKMGQFMSTRTDVFGAAITGELSKLQDNASGVDFQVLRPVIEAEIGHGLSETFAFFDPKPLASASIGQCHFAKMRVKGGGTADVVVKVKKPRVSDQIMEDLGILKNIAGVAAWTGTQRGKEAEKLLLQYETFLNAELDYKREVSNMLAFRETEAQMRDAVESLMATNTQADRIRVPRPYTALCTENVLVMEHVPSIKVTDVAALRAAGIEPKAVATAISNAFIAQIVKYGIVHCDPHPGNIGIAPRGDGRFDIVLYDFGNVVRLSESFRQEIKNLVVAVYQEDVDEFLALLIRLQIIHVNDPIDLLEVKSFFVYFFEYLRTVDFEQLRTSILDNETLQQSKIGFKVDNDFLALFRVFSLLDGTCTYLDPSFSYIEALAPVSQEIFQDMQFIEARVRKDFNKIMNFNQPNDTAKTAETTMMMAMNMRIRELGDKTNVFRGVFLALALLDGLDPFDPIRSVLIGFVVLWMAIAEGKMSKK